MSAKRIYFDNAATTPLYPHVADEISRILVEEYGNPSSIHAPGRRARTIIEKARKTIANHLNCSIGEIFFTSCATESNNTILSGAVRDLGVNHIIYSTIEHPSVMRMVEQLVESDGISTTKLAVDSYANINIEYLKEEIEKALELGKKPLVSIMWVNNELGTIQPIAEIARLCKEYNVLFHTDSVQAIAKYKIDLAELPISFLSASAHKFHGPKGIGFFYMNSDNIVEPLLRGGAQERNMRSGTENTAYIHGMAVAFDLAHKEMDSRASYVRGLRNYLINELKSNIDSVMILGNEDEQYQQYSICNVSFAPHPRNEMMMMNLDVAGISASGGSACSSGIEYLSHVQEAIKSDIDRTPVRFSLSPLNTKEEIDIVISELVKLQSKE